MDASEIFMAGFFSGVFSGITAAFIFEFTTYLISRLRRRLKYLR